MIIFIFKSMCLPKNKTIDLVADKILEIKPSKISIFQSKENTSTNSIQLNPILKKIIQIIPTFIIDFKDTEALNRSPKDVLNTRTVLNTDLYITFEDSLNFRVEKIKNTLNFIAELNSQPPRPKFLVILIGNALSTQVNLKMLFIDAWKLKFLDFSILMIHDNEKSVIRYYNPFFKNYHRNDLLTGQLFPDKLTNMNGYIIKFLLFKSPPHMEFTNKSNIITVDGINHGFWLLTSGYLNFTFDYVNMDNNFIAYSRSEKFGKDGTDVLIGASLLGSQISSSYKKGDILFGKIVREAEISLIGPIFYVPVISSDIYLALITYFIVTTSIILWTMIVVKLGKLDNVIWSPFYVFGLLYGITVNKIPQKWFDRLVYLSLAVLSVKYASDVFSIFSDDEIEKAEEIVYDVFKEIRNPSFPIYMTSTYFRGEMKNYDEVIQNLKR